MVQARRGWDNDAWLRKNFEKIVDRFGGKYPYVLVAGRRAFPVKSAEELPELEKKLRRKYGPTIGMPVPHPRDFLSVLTARPPAA